MEGKIKTVRLPEGHDRSLRVLAAPTKRSRSYFIREAVKRSLGDLEDAYLAETAYEDFTKCGEDSISLDEVERRLGLED
jgi:RHH-type rel operon transcriptional repressor/antitoxin RelB